MVCFCKLRQKIRYLSLGGFYFPVRGYADFRKELPHCSFAVRWGKGGAGRNRIGGEKSVDGEFPIYNYGVSTGWVGEGGAKAKTGTV